ncbi:retinol dehydrogenase 12-like [Palaemon carinicauda]|uniref:retinol dehydrogenase 12-like n=1 Tax=Palaemon carinicauda TaxID=392227 RepID=UPI0035B588FE
MEYMLGGILNFQWLKLKLFTSGWGYLFKEEKKFLATACSTAAVITFAISGDLLSTFFVCALIILVRRVFACSHCPSRKRLDGKTVVITGCNVGIGKETARELSRRGARIIMACRDTVKAERAAEDIRKDTGGELIVRKLDLASLASVRRFAEDVKLKEKRIHMLINNAGIFMCPYMKTEDGFEMQMGTNHLGHFLLTNLLLPLMTHSQPARVINISSIEHLRGVIPFEDMNYEQGYNRSKAYANSKLANVLFTRHLAKIVKGTNIQVFSLHPGVVQSDLGRHLLGGYLLCSVGFFQKTTVEGIQTVLHCALEAEQNDQTYYFSECDGAHSSRLSRRDDVAEKLWKVSAKMVGLEA